MHTENISIFQKIIILNTCACMYFISISMPSLRPTLTSIIQIQEGNSSRGGITKLKSLDRQRQLDRGVGIETNKNQLGAAQLWFAF